MNNKRSIVILFLGLVLVFGSAIYLLPLMNNSIMDSEGEKVIEEIKDEKVCYMYVYSSDCAYCNNIEKEIKEFSKKEKVFEINAIDIQSIVQNYDWEKHAQENDKEIGEKMSNGGNIFYNDLNEKEIMDKYPPLYYKIIWANEGYVAVNPQKKQNKIYAVSTHPILEEKDLQLDNLVVPGVPMLLKVEEGRITEYYFDDKEIINFLNSDIEPVDNYWNIE